MQGDVEAVKPPDVCGEGLKPVCVMHTTQAKSSTERASACLRDAHDAGSTCDLRPKKTTPSNKNFYDTLQ